jgi:hypothetical protein
VALPRIFSILEASHRIIDPFTPEKLRALGEAIGLRADQTMLDLACGKGEMLCTWSRDHGIRGHGVDINEINIREANTRAAELGVADLVSFELGDAQGYQSAEPVDIAACVGASWIGNGVAGTLALLAGNLKTGGMVLIGEPYWRLDPPDRATVDGCYQRSRDDLGALPELMGLFQGLGWDPVEMVLADQDSWDRYAAAQWLNLRRFIDAHPDDELVLEARQMLDEGPVQHTKYQREYLGWGVFALMQR